LVSNTAPNDSSHNSSGLGKTSKVHAVQSTVAKKSSKGNKKGKGKGKADPSKQGPPKSSSGDASQWNPKYPCLICDEDHYTNDFHRQYEVSCFLKETPTVLKELFPSQQDLTT